MTFTTSTERIGINATVYATRCAKCAHIVRRMSQADAERAIRTHQLLNRHG